MSWLLFSTKLWNSCLLCWWSLSSISEVQQVYPWGQTRRCSPAGHTKKGSRIFKQVNVKDLVDFFCNSKEKSGIHEGDKWGVVAARCSSPSPSASCKVCASPCRNCWTSSGGKKAAVVWRSRRGKWGEGLVENMGRRAEETKRKAGEKLWHHDFMNPSTSWLIYAWNSKIFMWSSAEDSFHFQAQPGPSLSSPLKYFVPFQM